MGADGEAAGGMEAASRLPLPFQEFDVADMIRSGAQWLEAKRLAYMTVPVAYRATGALIDTTCNATVSTATNNVMDTAGQFVTIQTRTFVIAVSELPSTPKRGDRITLTEGGVTVVYEVASATPGEAVWKWADRFHQCRKITAVPA